MGKVWKDLKVPSEEAALEYLALYLTENSGLKGQNADENAAYKD